MRFKGTKILFSEQLEKKIEKTPNSRKIMHTDNFGIKIYFMHVTEGNWRKDRREKWKV